MTFYERYSVLCQKQGKTPTGVGAELNDINILGKAVAFQSDIK